MDSFRIEEVPAELQENLEAAGAIVREQMDEFFPMAGWKRPDPENSGY